MKKFLLTLLFVSISLGVIAKDIQDLTQTEINVFKVQCLERIDAFKRGLEIIGDKRQDEEIKNHCIKILLEMFMENGNSWDVQNGRKQEAVKAEITSFAENRTHMYDIPLKVYLNKLRDTSNKMIDVNKVEVYIYSMNDLYKITEDLYAVDCQCFEFIPAQSNKLVFKRDAKGFYIHRAERYETVPSMWELLLGDISITENIKS